MLCYVMGEDERERVRGEDSGSKQQCCAGPFYWPLTDPLQLPLLLRERRRDGEGASSSLSCHVILRGREGGVVARMEGGEEGRRNGEQMETNLQTNGRNGSHYGADDGGAKSIVLL